MIKLKDISTKIYLDARFGERKYFICKNNQKRINRLQLTDLQKLKDYYASQQILSQQSKNEMSFDDDIKLLLDNVSEELMNGSVRDSKPTIYETSDAVIVDDEIVMLRESDKNVSPYVLLYGSPFEHYEDSWERIGYQPKKKVFVKKNIAELKDLLSHCTLEGDNAYSLYYPYINGHISHVLRALEMYEEQIIRQIKSTGKRPCEIYMKNIFNVYSDEKQALVREQYHEIADYLSGKDVFVWGEQSLHKNYDSHNRPPEAKLIYNSSHKNNFNARFNRLLLVNTIANYVSLEEAQKGLMSEDSKTKQKVIDRFVII